MTARPESRRLRLGRFETLQALSGGITHEINNLLASVVLSAELLEPCCRDAADREVLDSLAQLARRLQHAGRQLDWLARGVDGEPTLFQPQYLLADVQKLAAVAFPSTVTLVTRYPADLEALAGQPLRIHQLLLALALEALHHLRPTGGTVILAARNAAAADARAAGVAPTRPTREVAGTAAPADPPRGFVVLAALAEPGELAEPAEPEAAAASPRAAAAPPAPSSRLAGAAARARQVVPGGTRRWSGAVIRAAAAAGAQLEPTAARHYRGRAAWLPAAAMTAADDPGAP